MNYCFFALPQEVTPIISFPLRLSGAVCWDMAVYVELTALTSYLVLTKTKQHELKERFIQHPNKWPR